MVRTLVKGILITLAAIILLALWGVGRFMPKLVEHTFNDFTQFKLSIATNHTQLWRGHVAFEDVSIANPPTFSDPNLALFKELSVTVPFSLKLFTFDDITEVTVDEVTIDLQDIHWIINRDGSVNWILLGHQLREAFSEESKEEAKETPPATGDTPVLPLMAHALDISTPSPFIRTLRVRLGIFNYVSYLNPSAPDKKTIAINYERTFHDVKNLNLVFAAIVADLVQFQLNELAKGLFQEFTNPEQINQAIEKASEQLKNIDASSVKDVSRAAKDIFKSFGQ